MKKRLLKIWLPVLALCFSATSLKAQYCTPTVAVQDETITNVVLGTINNPSGYGGGYSDYSALSTTVAAGNTVNYNVTVLPNYTLDQVFIWVDLNNNFTFDASELLVVSAQGGGTYAGTFTIPAGSTAGAKRARIRLNYNNTATDPCTGSTYGETEDYTINVTTTACTGTPNPGNTLSTTAAACGGVPFTLSVQNSTSGSGVTYQWQSSPTGVAGSYTNIAGATAASYVVANQTVSTYYHLVVTCGGSSVGTSTGLLVTQNAPTACYCTPGSTNCNAGDEISNVTLAGINNTTACSAAGYGNYLSLTGTLLRGIANPLSVTVTNGGTEYVGVWVDYNQNGQFEASEFQAQGSGPGGTFTTPLNVPATALLGTTRMRVRVEYGTAITGANQCTVYTYGETEDYTVTIGQCVATPLYGQPASASIVCGTNATFTVTDTSSLPTYQWEYRVNSSSPWLLVPNAAPYSGVNTATLTVTGATGALSGYQYRAVVTGACKGPDVSNAATLTVTPITLAITPTSITKCAAAAPVAINAPSTQTVVSFTNSTPGAVADGDLVGITRPVTVSGITGPVQKVRVKINATSNYIGDLVIALKAPNGQIINLDYLLNRTNNGPSTGTGFINTIFNLNRTVRNYAAYNVPAAQAIDQFNAPYTAEFPIDNQQALYFVGVPSGPTGFAANTTDPTTLYPTAASANGVWTLAMYDAGPPDPATFQNYTLEITYGGAPATMVLTPSTGLYTNAAGTTPYTGTAVTTVYANPAANTTYSAVVSTGACSGAAQTIQVNVNSPVGGTATLANNTICANTNTSFALGGTLTGGPAFSHNFQVSTNNGVSYTNIANGGVYSGANTNTLVLTNVPYSYNGYKFRDSINTPGSCGSLISAAATLTVNPTPVVTISAAPVVNVYPGITSTLTAAVSSATAPLSYQWYLNGNAVPGATANTYTVGVDQEGSYSVSVTDANGCTAAKGTSTPGSISIGDSSGVTILFIYPSPNSGQFQVRYFNDINNGGTAPAFVNVYDSKGARVFTRQYSLGAGYQAMKVNMGNHAKGLYRVELIDLNGNRIKTGSVMVF